jgi:arginase family enzyme
MRQRHRFVLWLGGNHASVFPVLELLEPETLVLHFDAHVDIHSFDHTWPTISHGNYWRFLKLPRPQVWHFGHRDLFVVPEQAQQFFQYIYSANDIAQQLTQIIEQLRVQVQTAPRIWIDIDADVFDPSLCPAVQQPLPFGLNSYTFWPLWQAAWSGRVIGVSLSEFDPGRDFRDLSLHMLGWLVESTLLQAGERSQAEWRPDVPYGT